ncbi:hypothetical protein DOM22_14870 [Bdellovibrio sp. ZAP7]|uniref:hypothetical protein n=1 Tax=Bdellovibrio sp. ZAP7 TaxID=2231053 RepID=UPI0011656BD2|nr:hypothetical protein [Bdellovibrio sp. ZAP7]QDK46357.1 hypothetical protein DOM22_14870 [Bdellovibrio sp. ZAP7]
MRRISICISILSLLSLTAFAKSTEKKKDEKRKPSQTFNYTVYSEDFPQDQLDGPVNGSSQEAAVLNPGQRDVILGRAGLTNYVASWDHLEKDILVLRASKNSFEVLRSKYPKLPPAALQQLQLLLKTGK